ncbi:MAG: hypothetical protein AAFY15_08670, partial [Cyanobacteria bacterium J06648_11]
STAPNAASSASARATSDAATGPYQRVSASALEGAGEGSMQRTIRGPQAGEDKEADVPQVSQRAAGMGAFPAVWIEQRSGHSWPQIDVH